MKILFLGGYFESEVEEQITRDSSVGIQYAANKFQRNIIRGLEAEGVDFEVLSAPFVAPYPRGYKKFFFSPIVETKREGEIQYVSFCNLWGYRNISRRRALIKSVKEFANLKEEKKVILVYSLHTPLLQAALFAKKRDSRIKICVVVPDLPQYMSFSNRKWSLYNLLKRFDIKVQRRLLSEIDAFVVLTEKMTTFLGIEKKPYVVVEGIADASVQYFENCLGEKYEKKVCLYAGGLQEAYGIALLCEAFTKADVPNSELHIYGRGDYESALKHICRSTNRIKYLGTKSNSEIVQEEIKATLLINPRPVEEEFTKYSFPSKNMEYMASGTPVLTTRLPGMPEEYNKYVYLIDEVSVDGISRALTDVLSLSRETLHEKGASARNFVLREKSYIQQTRKILDLIKAL